MCASMRRVLAPSSHRDASTAQERRVSIGRPGVFSVDQARAQARELLRGMRLGVDPVEEKARKQAQGITLRQTIADYCTHRRTKNGPLRTRTKADISDHGDRSFADWLDKPITAISRDDCFNRLARLSKTAPSRANQGFVILRALLNFARNRYRTNDAPLMVENPVDVLKHSWHPKTRSPSGSLTPGSVRCGVCLPSKHWRAARREACARQRPMCSSSS